MPQTKEEKRKSAIERLERDVLMHKKAILVLNKNVKDFPNVLKNMKARLAGMEIHLSNTRKNLISNK